MTNQAGEWPEFAEYFDRVPAVFVSVPSQHRDIHPDDFANQIRPIVEETFGVDPEVALTAQVQKYQIGSAAEWSRTLAIVIEQAIPTASFLASVVTIAPVVQRLLRRLRDHNTIEMADFIQDESGLIPSAVPPKIGLPMAIGLAGAHYQATYSALQGVSINWFARATDHMSSVEHPSGRETYIIKLEKDHENFIYHISGEGRCTEHFYLAGHRLIPLNIPNWLDEVPYDHPRQLAVGRVDEQT
jgi:hypothetical protein